MTATIEVRQAQQSMEGDGVSVARLMPVQGFMNFDPFALWDHFKLVPNSGFPDHAHRGFEAITYIFSGSMNHSDKLGNNTTVNAGGAQRFTAGSGIVHAEMPAPVGETNGIQLWINLPKRLKSIPPDYQQVNAENIPEEKFSFGLVRHIVGLNSPLKLKTTIHYRDIQFNASGDYQTPILDSHQGFIYLVEGSANLLQHKLSKGDSLFFSNLSNLIITGNQATRIMFCSGVPHGEKMHQHGSYVD